MRSDGVQRPVIDGDPSARAPVAIPQTEGWTLRSLNVRDTFAISVALPPGYHATDRAYPVLYVLDANAVFGTVTESYRLLGFDDEICEAIIVGVGYPGVTTVADTMHLRTRDYTPTDADWYRSRYAARGGAPDYIGEGEASTFLRFIEDELKPFITITYRTDPEDAGLVGYSFSGLFALYALLGRPGLFQRYLVCSPSTWWDDRSIFSIEQEAAARDGDLRASVLMAVGADEPAEMIAGMYDMAVRLTERNDASLSVATRVIEGAGHLEAFSAFIGRALLQAYGIRALPTDA